MAETPRYYAYLCEQGRTHAQPVLDAEDHEHAAMSFAHDWSETADEVDVAVFEAGSSIERRYHISIKP